jgi:hypothetical protein
MLRSIYYYKTNYKSMFRSITHNIKTKLITKSKSMLRSILILTKSQCFKINQCFVLYINTKAMLCSK